MNCSPPGSSVLGTLQARILEWVAISFSRGSSWPRDWTQLPALQADSLPTELWGKPSLVRQSSGIHCVCMRAKSLQHCLTLCDAMDSSPPGLSVHGILQAKTMEWVVLPYSRGSSWSRDWTQVSCIVGGFLIEQATKSLKSPALAGGFFTTVCMYVSCSVMSDSLWPRALQPARVLCPWNSSDKHTGLGCHSLLQGIIPTQGLNPGLLPCGQILYSLSHQGSHEDHTLHLYVKISMKCKILYIHQLSL